MAAFFSPGNQALMHPQEVCALKEATPAGCCSHGFWAPGTPVGLGEEESPLVSSPWGFLGLSYSFAVYILSLPSEFRLLYVYSAGRQHVGYLGLMGQALGTCSFFKRFLLLRCQVLLLAELALPLLWG